MQQNRTTREDDSSCSDGAAFIGSALNHLSGYVVSQELAWIEDLLVASVRFAYMTPDKARQMVIDGINYAAYDETDYSLYDSDKHRLFRSEHYNSGRTVCEPSPWAEGDFEEKMAMLLVWANMLNRVVPAFTEAQRLLEAEDSILGRVIRNAINRKATGIVPGTKFSRR